MRVVGWVDTLLVFLKPANRQHMNKLFTWLLMMCLVVTNFVLFFPQGVLGGVWNGILSAPENFPTSTNVYDKNMNFCS